MPSESETLLSQFNRNPLPTLDSLALQPNGSRTIADALFLRAPDLTIPTCRLLQQRILEEPTGKSAAFLNEILQLASKAEFKAFIWSGALGFAAAMVEALEVPRDPGLLVLLSCVTLLINIFVIMSARDLIFLHRRFSTIFGRHQGSQASGRNLWIGIVVYVVAIMTTVLVYTVYNRYIGQRTAEFNDGVVSLSYPWRWHPADFDKMKAGEDAWRENAAAALAVNGELKLSVASITTSASSQAVIFSVIRTPTADALDTRYDALVKISDQANLKGDVVSQGVNYSKISVVRDVIVSGIPVIKVRGSNSNGYVFVSVLFCTANNYTYLLSFSYGSDGDATNDEPIREAVIKSIRLAGSSSVPH